MDMEEKKEDLQQKSSKKGHGKRYKRVLGALLLAAGILIMVSAIVVPVINRKNNDKDIEDIRNGKYAGEVTAAAVSEEAAAVTGQAVSPMAVQPDERDVKMQQILADNTRIGIVEIEKINVLYAVVEGTEDEQINRAVGHLKESAGIGQQGNCVIAGHRGGYYGTFFERLPELENGDVIKMTDVNGTEYCYAVYDKKEVHPADWSVVRDLSDLHTLTLITCEDDTRKRIVVHAAMFWP